MEIVFGASIEVPAISNAPIWAEVVIKKTFVGKLASAAYKPPVMAMTAKFRNRSSEVYRIIPGMMSGGFLLSPVVADTKSFASLFEPDWRAELARREMQSMVIAPATASGSSICYEPSFTVRFYRLEILP